MLRGVLQFVLRRRPLVLLGLLVFVVAGMIAFSRLNIEAYPNPAPVILEITAQAAGQSAEEMERYYTIPMEVGLAATPGVDNIRSTSFYGLSFVRVTFNYGVDYYFALEQAAISLQQNVSLPNNVMPQIQGSSLVGEIYRYQVVGPPHFGLTNLRTVQDWNPTAAEAQNRIAQNVKLPSGYRLEWAGEFEELQQAKARLAVIVPLSLLLILVLLYVLFNSLRDSLMVLAGIPFAAGGGVLALYLTGLAFSISAAVGFISLFGVSVMNGILIMTYYNEVKATGMNTIEAMFHAASQRMRPMLMTALSACIGLLPAAISSGIGSQVQRPLATVVVGGMFIGPIILLVVVPALQTLFLDREDHTMRAPDPGAAQANA